MINLVLLTHCRARYATQTTLILSILRNVSLVNDYWRMRTEYRNTIMTYTDALPSEYVMFTFMSLHALASG